MAAIHRLLAQRSLVQRRGLSAEMIMSKQNNGGPAFPHSARLVAPDTYEHFTNGGMSLRDYFAAKAMQSIVSSPEGMESLIDALGAKTAYAEVSKTAYLIADEMIRAREAL